MHTNMNFPAPLAVLGFLAAMGGLAITILTLAVLAVLRQTKWLRRIAAAAGVCAAVYLGLLLAFSAGSREQTLSAGGEKYFCEIDCHLAYSVRASHEEFGDSRRRLYVTVQTRFDENTFSPRRPKDAPLTPNPRQIVVADGWNRNFAPSAMEGTPLTQELVPGEAYETTLAFDLPPDARQLRLLISSPGWEEHLLIGDENSFGHKKTFLGIAPEAIVSPETANK